MIQINNAIYQEQLQQKKNRLVQILAPYGLPDVTVFDSPIQNFRMRTEFRIWHQKDEAHYAMFLNSGSTPVFLENFPYVSVRINTLMPQLKILWNLYPILRDKLFQVNFLTTLSDDSIITLCYHKKLDDHWLSLAKKIAEKLNTKIIGRSKNQKIATHKDYVIETLTILDRTYYYVQPENSFTQPNAYINQKMIAWVCKNIGSDNKDLLELYCGNGNFTIPVSHYVRRIFASEISKLALWALKKNLSMNQIENITFARLSAEELTQAMNQLRPFRRLVGIDLKSYDFTTVLVDPPRSGLDEETCQFISQFPNIIYISCNPETLAYNLQILSKTHCMVAGAMFDQFAYSDHIESGVLLKKNSFK